MAISRRDLLRRMSVAAAGAVAMPSVTRASSGAPEGPIHLDRNENPYGPPPRAMAAVQDSVRGSAHLYPDRATDILRDTIARVHRVKADQIVLGCGSGEILRMAAGAFLDPGSSVITARPTYELMADEARRVGAEVVAVPLTHDYEHALDAMLWRCDASTKLVYICNPNNPTGTLTKRQRLEAFIRQLPGTAYVLVDEAYHDYAGETVDHASFIDRPVDSDRVIVVRSFSALFGLAGLRVGYGIAAPPAARLLDAKRLDANVNVMGALAAAAALDDRMHVRLSVMSNVDERQEFVNEAHARMLKPIDSATNFVMFDTGQPATTVIEHFRKNNVVIAPPVSGWDTYVRVSLGTQAEMREFWRVWDLMPARRMSM